MYIVGTYISIVDVLMVVAGLIIVCMLYLAHEIRKLKELERRFEGVEKLMELEEKEIEEDLKVVRKRGARKGR